MSVTVTLLPISLLYSIIPLAIPRAINMAIDIKDSLENLGNTNNSFIHLSENITNEIFNKELDTNFMDKDTLLKTLIEHGATNIIENNENITCDCEAFHLEFFKIPDLPYKVIISCQGNNNINNFINDINTEYSANVQEISYNKVKENLEAQNLEIEEEEILEDNTIVLTINLED